MKRENQGKIDLALELEWKRGVINNWKDKNNLKGETS